MASQFQLDILPQPDNITCGPTCLHAVYRYYGDDLPLTQVIDESPRLEDGGTLAVLLGCAALRRGYQAQIFTCNLQVFDPTWFRPDAPPLADRLRAQMEAKDSSKLRAASTAYLDFLARGGEIHMQEFTPEFMRKYLKRGIPILTGLSATYLYQCAREYGPTSEPDDVRGLPVGHFVVLYGYDKDRQHVLVADPFLPNPLGPAHYYEVSVHRVIRAVLLGILTYDANLLIIQPAKHRKGVWRAHLDRGQ